MTKQTLVQLKKIVSFLISIPARNAYPERVFSHMNNIWSKERNRMTVNLVKAKLQAKLNIAESCSEFADLRKRTQVGRDW
jgi:hypothetical protein